MRVRHTGPVRVRLLHRGFNDTYVVTDATGLAALFRGPDSPETERAQWSALLAGYETVRPLHPDERAALPVFAACCAFWNIGDWLWTVDRNGQIWPNDRLCERTLSDARQPLAGLHW